MTSHEDDFQVDLSGPGHIEVAQIEKRGRWFWAVRVDGKELARGTYGREFTQEELDGMFEQVREYLMGIN